MMRLTPRGRVALAVLVTIVAAVLGWWLSPGRVAPVAPVNQGVMVCGEALDGMPGVACFHPADVPAGATGTWTIPAR